ncbi:riboflavin biosynthesis protein RibD [Leucobacter sp. Psy1]|uniref:dihydrofolate reductase family protein n=1 Tax=Leucobacter sp. Psy1 TaxID=2875729 RepID=UPI001CD5A418|nr:dihydrofolate reductase family protein [Leucobacter sp. Psy1]UBH05279.1 riboflavin biosynthesis protein RibD [Leucobacter sp. Psy1]
MTRKITAHLFHSLNDVVEHPDRWQFDGFGAEEGELMGEMLASTTDTIIGRKLWQEWSEYWPQADDPFAQWINPVRKHVLSSTLSADLPWNSVLVSGDPVSYIRELREQGKGDISVAGGIETVRSLFLAGLVDELTLTTHPVVAAEGRRLFDEHAPLTRLRLLRAVQTEAGNAILTYTLRPGSEADGGDTPAE